MHIHWSGGDPVYLMRTARTALLLTVVVSGILASVGASAAVAMAVDTSAPVTISGNAVSAIEPGTWSALDLTITNDQSMPVKVSRLSVSIVDIYAPFSDADNPCSAKDYEIIQSRSLMVFEVAAGTSRDLSSTSLGVENWPKIAMIDRDSNQNGCRGASLTLSYSAATSVMTW